MKEIPILFSTPMVQAILEGRKTMTRRIVKDVETDVTLIDRYNKTGAWTQWIDRKIAKQMKCRYGQPGDVLWVRETFGIYSDAFLFKAGDIGIFKGIKWKPSIHMFKDYARIWLKVEEIRVERLQKISEGDARREGVKFASSTIGPCYLDYINGGYNAMTTAYHSFRSLWRKINGIESWDSNPWVWVIEFKVLSTTGKPQ